MKKSLLCFLAAAALALTMAACTSLGAPQPQTFEQRAAATLIAVDGVNKAATTLLKADKISVADAKHVAAQSDTVIVGVGVARTIAATDPVAAQTKLAAGIAVLTVLQGYLASKGATP
jgi:hypothetical protein